ncbi:MAG: serine hydrolase [Desulfobacula sp.]|nr:serine hydrolase [Desulfobacula sp.]
MAFEKITLRMNQAVFDGVFPGAVLLFSINAKIVFHKAFGMANIYEKTKMTRKNIFDLASLTKPLATTLAIAKIMEDNPRLLDRNIGSILKEFKPSDKAKITIDMLLRHTSGYPAHREYFKEVFNSKKNPRLCFRDYLVDQDLENKIGTKQVYSDLGFMVLAWIIEIMVSQRLDEYVCDQIYRPLGIKHLFFIPMEKRKQMIKTYGDKLVATQACPWRKRLLVGEVDDENAWAAGGVEGHAGLFGDAFSVFILCCELMGALQGNPSKVLNRAVINRLVQKKGNNEKVAGFDTPSRINSSAGHFFSAASIGHLGFTGTSFWMDPESSLIVILLTNRIHPSRSNEGIKKFRPQIHDLITAELT